MNAVPEESVPNHDPETPGVERPSHVADVEAWLIDVTRALHDAAGGALVCLAQEANSAE